MYLPWQSLEEIKQTVFGQLCINELKGKSEANVIS